MLGASKPQLSKANFIKYTENDDVVHTTPGNGEWPEGFCPKVKQVS